MNAHANVARNPWGKGKKGIWEGAWSDGSKEFTPEIQQELNHKFGNDSVFWISYEDLLHKYQHFERTRLFMDNPDWRITQKWISIDVPWKSAFEQKFRIVLKKDSPVVLVLSQLDDRYFDGLQGQYTFRLQFRLHEVNSHGENDYIVRSHGNYLMERSVVTELNLEAGTYSVFVMVVADRDTSSSSVEDVVKAQCKRKVDNDKLAQVGMSYDLAHSKSASYIESKQAARKAHDKAKAREARIGLRKKNWEKRHLSREIVRKQDKKDREKRERKEARDAAEAKEKEEKAPKDKSVQTEDVAIILLNNEDKGMQTEDRAAPNAESEDKGASSTESEETIMPPTATAGLSTSDVGKGSQADDASSTTFGSQCTPETPKSSSRENSPHPNLSRVSSLNINLGHSRAGIPPPPPPPFPRERVERKSSIDRRNYSGGPAERRQYIPSDGESSASPISDYDDIYSDDDPTLKPRQIQTTGEAPPESKHKRGGESDDEDEVEAWNAVCLVGFRVYSQDEGLELRIWEEGNEDESEKSDDIEKDEEGTDGDVEDGGEGEKKEGGKEKDKEQADTNEDGQPVLPLRVKEEPELVLVDCEKRAMGLGAEEKEEKGEVKVEVKVQGAEGATNCSGKVE